MSTLKGMKLLEILRLLNTVDESERKGLWDFMSAMRGPDNQNHALKEEYTEPIRGFVDTLASERASTWHREPYDSELKDRLQMLERLDRNDENWDHWRNHILMAYRALLGRTAA